MSRRKRPPVLPPPPVVTATALRPQVRFRLAQGARLEYQGRHFTVVGFTGDGSRDQEVRVQLRDEENLPVEVVLVDLASDPTFRPLDPHSQPIPVLNAYHAHWEALDGQIRLAALEREQHVLEVLSGYASGHASSAAPGEPRQPYQAARLGDRIKAKSAELGVTTRQVERWLQNYREKGHHPYGLIDLNAFRLSNRLGKQESVIADAILHVAKGRQDASDVTFTELRAQVQDRLDTLHRKGKLPTAALLPSQPTFIRLVKHFAPELTRLAKRRHSDASRDRNRRFHKLVSTRAGQYVMLDITPLDLLAKSEVDGHQIRLRLILAIDHYTRAVVAATFIEVEPKGVDVASLLLDILFPLRPHPDWPALPEGARLPYAGLPEAILLAAHEMPEGSALVNIPPLMPEAVVVDNGMAFLSQEFLEMCAQLEIDVLYARPGTGSDKAHVERAFRTIREGISQKLRGYVGPNVQARGRNVGAFHFSWEVQFEITQWIALSYNHATHGGLFHPTMPKVKLSPSQMYAISLEHAGYLAVPLGQDSYFLALRTVLRTISDVGVRSNGHQYDSDVLNGHRNTDSPYLEFEGKWPFKVDKRDDLRIYWQNPDSLVWHELPDRDADWRARPFQGAMTDQIKVVLEERDFTLNNSKEITMINRELRSNYTERVLATERQAKAGADEGFTASERHSQARLARAKADRQQRTQAQEAQALQAPSALDDGHDSHEWDQDLDLNQVSADSDLMGTERPLIKVVGDEF